MAVAGVVGRVSLWQQQHLLPPYSAAVVAAMTDEDVRKVLGRYGLPLTAYPGEAAALRRIRVAAIAAGTPVVHGDVHLTKKRIDELAALVPAPMAAPAAAGVAVPAVAGVAPPLAGGGVAAAVAAAAAAAPPVPPPPAPAPAHMPPPPPPVPGVVPVMVYDMGAPAPPPPPPAAGRGYPLLIEQYVNLQGGGMAKYIPSVMIRHLTVHGKGSYVIDGVGHVPGVVASPIMVLWSGIQAMLNVMKLFVSPLVTAAMEECIAAENLGRDFTIDSVMRIIVKMETAEGDGTTWVCRCP